MSIKHLERLIQRKGKVYTKEELDAFYSSKTWRKCRENILKRDDYLCQKCLEDDIPTPADTVHHIIHVKDDPTLALEASNLISLCRECHEREHGRLGTEGNELEGLPKSIEVFTVNKNPKNIW